MSTDSQDGPSDDSNLNVPDSDEFWRTLLGRKYDNMDAKEKTDRNLIEEVYRRESDIVDRIHNSKQGLISELQSDESDAETVLMTIWAAGKWQDKSPGPEYEFDEEDDIENEFDRIAESDFLVDKLNRDLYIVWTRKQVSRPREENESVRSHLDDDWSPLFVRKTDTKLIEVRGRERRRHQFSSELAEEDKAKKVLKELSEQSVLEDLSSVFSKDIATLVPMEIRFRRSKLPDASALTLRNEIGVQQDLQDDTINSSVISPKIASKIDYIKFRDEKSDNIAKVSVNRRSRGFSFDLQASYISDEETENIREIIEEKFNISFDKVYPYHLQHQNESILQQILSGDVDSYEHYYEDLDKRDKYLIKRFISYEESLFSSVGVVRKNTMKNLMIARSAEKTAFRQSPV